HQQRENHSDMTEGRKTQDHCGDDGDLVAFENVCGHSGAVADVVTDVVGDGRGVARVVFGNIFLDLADQIGADVGGFGVNTATDAHEKGEQGSTEAEAQQRFVCLLTINQENQRSTE